MLHCKFSFQKLTSISIATTLLQTKKTKNYILNRELAQLLATTKEHFLKTWWKQRTPYMLQQEDEEDRKFSLTKKKMMREQRSPPFVAFVLDILEEL